MGIHEKSNDEPIFLILEVENLMSDELKLPGTEIERAAAGEITRAGNTLIGALAGLLERWTIIGNTEAKARAAERAKDIEQEGTLRREKELTATRRESELDEIEYRYSLAQRATGRLQALWLQDQENAEKIARFGIALANEDPEGDKERPLDNDWLLRFFQYASTVDDTQLQAVMARVLADASIANRPLTSRRAIDTIRFFETSSYKSFQFIAQELTLWGSVPVSYFSLRQNSAPPDFDMSELIELGLIKRERHKSFTLSLGKLRAIFTFAPRQTFSFELVLLTQIGREIASLLYPEVRRRFPSGVQNIDAHELWIIQKKLGLSEKHVQAAAIAIVQEASDYWDISYDIFLQTDSTQTYTVFHGVRNNIHKPYSIPDLDFADHRIDPQLSSYAQIIVNEFRYFDERQLPNLNTDPFGEVS